MVFDLMDMTRCCVFFSLDLQTLEYILSIKPKSPHPIKSYPLRALLSAAYYKLYI